MPSAMPFVWLVADSVGRKQWPRLKRVLSSKVLYASLFCLVVDAKIEQTEWNTKLNVVRLLYLYCRGVTYLPQRYKIVRILSPLLCKKTADEVIKMCTECLSVLSVR